LPFYSKIVDNECRYEHLLIGYEEGC